MVEKYGTIRLGYFGGTQDLVINKTNWSQTVEFTWGWADSNARDGRYSKKSDVYAFGLNAYYILYAEPLFTRANENAYEKNIVDFDNGYDDACFLTGTIK